jgi:hypothetical protein
VDATAPLQDGFVRKHFTVPLQTYGSDTSGNQGYFNVLDVTDRQAYISQWVSEPCMQKAHKCSAEMLSVGKSHACNETQCNVVKPLAEKLEQIASVDGYFRDYGDAESGFDFNPKTIAVHAYLDPHMLYRTEWVKFMAAFFNKEDVAQKYMDDQQEEWEASTAQGIAAGDTPLVVIGVTGGWYQKENGDWACCEHQLSMPAYFTTAVTAAAGKSYTTADFSTNEHVTLRGCDAFGNDGKENCMNPKVAFDASDPNAVAAFHAALSAADVIFDYTSSSDNMNYRASEFAEAYGFEAGAAPTNVFRFDGVINENNGMDWFEGAKVKPAVLLADMVAALHSTGGERTYFRRLDETPTLLKASDCARELPVCKLCRPVCSTDQDAIAAWRDDVTVQAIDAPCDRYDCSIKEATEDIVDASEVSVCAAAALLMAAAAYA